MKKARLKVTSDRWHSGWSHVNLIFGKRNIRLRSFQYAHQAEKLSKEVSKAINVPVVFGKSFRDRVPE